MNTITLTDLELNELRKAVEMYNDMINDMAFESLYIPSGTTKTFSSDELKHIREEVEENMMSIFAVKALCEKLDIDTNEAGYSK